MASVKVVEHGNGDVSLGFEADGVFVPVASARADRIAHYKERAATLAERLEADPEDKEAVAAVEAQPTSAEPKESAKKEKAS